MVSKPDFCATFHLSQPRSHPTCFSKFSEALRMTDQETCTFLKERENLIGLACQIVKDHAVAEDLVQDSWLRWSEQNYPQCKAPFIFRKIVTNLAKDWYRRQKTERDYLTLHLPGEVDAPDSERVFLARQDLKKVVAALRRAPKRSVFAFRLHRSEGYSYARIAKELQVSPSTAFKLVEDVLVEVVIALRR